MYSKDAPVIATAATALSLCVRGRDVSMGTAVKSVEIMMISITVIGLYVLVGEGKSQI